MKSQNLNETYSVSWLEVKNDYPLYSTLLIFFSPVHMFCVELTTLSDLGIGKCWVLFLKIDGIFAYEDNTVDPLNFELFC
jgi:hypothetical protein